MTSAGDASGNFSAHDWANAPWRCGTGRSHWTPLEIAAMVLGFVFFWPVGLAILGYKMWTRRYGGADLQTMASGAFSRAQGVMNNVASAKPGAASPWRGFASQTVGSGNRAFDDWKATQVSRLDEERRKLDDERKKLDEAHKEFNAFVEQVRHAKDREEFERFMKDRAPKEG